MHTTFHRPSPPATYTSLTSRFFLLPFHRHAWRRDEPLLFPRFTPQCLVCEVTVGSISYCIQYLARLAICQKSYTYFGNLQKSHT
jgi:hypothetical protein